MRTFCQWPAGIGAAAELEPRTPGSTRALPAACFPAMVLKERQGLLSVYCIPWVGLGLWKQEPKTFLEPGYSKRGSWTSAVWRWLEIHALSLRQHQGPWGGAQESNKSSKGSLYTGWGSTVLDYSDVWYQERIRYCFGEDVAVLFPRPTKERELGQVSLSPLPECP